MGLLAAAKPRLH